jgi:hypothetical protein
MTTGSLVVRELGEHEGTEWDRFVAASPQGTIFSETIWLQAIGSPFRIFGCYKGVDLVGGTVVVEDEKAEITRGIVPLTPYQGILFRDHSRTKRPTRHSLEMRITGALLDELEQRYRDILLINHYTFHDLRPFYFRTYGTENEYDVHVRYTHIVDLRDLQSTWAAMDDNTHWEIRKAEKGGITVCLSNDFECFTAIHQHTFERQGVDHDIPSEWLTRIYELLHREGRCQIYLAFNPEGKATSGLFVVWDNKRAYFLLGGSEPAFRNNGSASLALWTAFQSISKRVPEFDLEGCNSPRRGSFKAGFGGQLRHYFWVSLRRTSRGRVGAT